MKSDVLLVFDKETGASIATSIEGWMRNRGYVVQLACENDLDTIDDSVSRTTTVLFLCTGAVLDSSTPLIDKVLSVKDRQVIPIWPNNCKPWAWPKKVPSEIVAIREMSPCTIDMIGTDFEISIEKVCAKFPEPLRSKNAFIRECISKAEWGKLLIRHPELVYLCPLDAISARDWIDVVDKHPDLADQCRWNVFSGWDWRVLFRRHPEYAGFCNWNSFSGGDWAEVLVNHPEFNIHCDWDKLDGNGFSKILTEHPEFSSHCKWNKLDGRDWVNLIVKRRQFADRCPWWKLDGSDWVQLLLASDEFVDKCKWIYMTGEDWSQLLRTRPEYTEKCRWEVLSGHDIARLLARQPQLVDLCDLKKLKGDDWARLLRLQPGLADKCDFGKFNGADWVTLFSSELLVRESEFRNGAWCCPTAPARPEFADRCDWWALIGRDWVALLSEHPEFAGHCDWSKLTEDDWERILRVRPEFAEHRPPKRIVQETAKPQTAQSETDTLKPRFDAFIAFDEFESGDIAERLASALTKRGYAVYVADAAEASIDAVEAAKYFLLIRSPGLYDRLDDESSLVHKHLRHALDCGKIVVPIGPSDRPWQESRAVPNSFIATDTLQVKNLDMGNLFEEKVDDIINDCMKGETGELNKCYDIFISYRRSTGANAARLLQQQFKSRGYTVFLDYDSIRNGKYDQVILSALDKVQVFLMLLTERSLDRCSDPNDWVAAEIVKAIELGKCIIPVTPDNSTFTDPPEWSERLLSVRGMKVNRIAVGDGLDGSIDTIEKLFPADLIARNAEIRQMMRDGEWCELICRYPELKDVCEWEALTDHDWTRVLSEHPQFADRCDWSKIGKYRPFGLGSHHSDWVDLLMAQPQFAKYCDLSSLDSENKAEVLSRYPILAEQNDWRGLSERDFNGVMHWVHVLKAQPQFSDKCDFGLFTGKDWVYLLKSQPQFADKCDFGLLRGADWVGLLKSRPEFLDECEWRNLAGEDLCQIVENMPEIAEKCDWECVSGSAWAILLAKHPECADSCDWDVLDGEDWNVLLAERPEFACYCGPLVQMHDMIEEAESISSGDGYGLDVGMLLWLWPEFVAKVSCDDLAHIDIAVWIKLLVRDEAMAEYCDWDVFSGDELTALLIQCPQFADKCDWSKFDGEMRDEILAAHPELSKYID